MRTFLKTQILLLISALLVEVAAAEQTAVVNEGRINVRGQPSLVGEVVTQLQRGDQVTILEYIPADDARAGEPTNWAKIKLPSNTPVWVYSPMVKDGAVAVSRLNLRAGPGENYSVIGRLDRGEKINTIRTVGDWAEIEAPPIAYAFVDSTLVTPSEPAENAAGNRAGIAELPAVASTPTGSITNEQPSETALESPAATPAQDPLASATADPLSPATTPGTRPPGSTPSIESPAAAVQLEPQPPTTNELSPAFAETPSSSPTRPQTQPLPDPLAPSALPSANAQAIPAVTASQPGTPASEFPRSRRVVTREGIVRPTISIQAPTWYELVHPDTRRTIGYLYEEKLGIKLKPYKGRKVIVTGEEAVDPRWPNTPILQLESLEIAP